MDTAEGATKSTILGYVLLLPLLILSSVPLRCPGAICSFVLFYPPPLSLFLSVSLLSHLVGGVAWVSAPAHQSKQVAAEEHLDDADASVAEHSSERLSERIHVVDAEPVIRAASEAS